MDKRTVALLMGIAAVWAVCAPAALADGATLTAAHGFTASALDLLKWAPERFVSLLVQALPDPGVVLLVAMGVGALRLMRRRAAACYGAY